MNDWSHPIDEKVRVAWMLRHKQLFDSLKNMEEVLAPMRAELRGIEDAIFLDIQIAYEKRRWANMEIGLIKTKQ